MTAVECGAACLGMVLAHFGRTVPLSTLRVRCAVDRDGASALAIIRAARTFELEPKAQLVSLWQLTQIALPAIAFWYEAHFVVIEAVAPRGIRVNDPSSGRRWVTWEEADRAVSGVVVEFHKGPQFKPGGQRTTTRSFIMSWMSGSWSAVHFAVALGLCGALMAVLVPLLSREYANGVLQQGNPNNAFPLALATMASAVLLGLITFGQKLALVRLMVKLADQSARNLMHNMLLAPLTFFSSRPAGDLAGRVMLTSQVSQVLAYQLAPALLALLTIAICLLVLAILVGWLLAALAVLAVLAEISALYAVQRSRVARSRQVAAARLGYLAAATQTMRSMELLKSSGYESAAFTDVTGLQAKASNAFQDLQRPALVVGPIPTMVSKLASVILLVGGALLIFDGETTVGTIIAALSLLAGALAPGQTLVQVGQALQTLPGDLERISDAMKSSQPPAQCRETVSMGGRIQGRLQLKDVTFGYSPDQPILRSIDLSVNPGEHVALVGATGSGKTTLGRLILGLLEPWEGQVLIDDVDRTQIPAHELRADLAGVDQAIVLFSGTIRDNLTLWDPTVPDAVLDSASEDADILKVIIGRGGYDAPVNHDGENFSGGERQRLELARALASDPAILVLDEATSALDPIASRKIGRSLKARGCTTFTIAHRLGSIRDSDQILVLVKGQIVERGTHNELMAQRAYYYDLVAEDNARRGSE